MYYLAQIGHRVTLADVAARAGVHPGTASRALSPDRQPLVRQATLQRVLKAAADLGYEPDLLARGLRTHRSSTAGVLVPDLEGPAVLPLLRGIEDGLAAAGYAALVASAGRRTGPALTRMRSRHVDGLILAGHAASPGFSPGLPAVAADPPHPAPGVPTVAADHALGASLVLSHLAGLGHQHVARIGLREGPPGPAHVMANADTPGEGARCCRELLERQPHLTAIAAASDLLAAGCCAALAQAGLGCPADVTVVGYGDQPLSAALWPPLTTVRLPHREIGRQAAALLLGTISGRPASLVACYLAPELVVRASSAACSLRSRNRIVRNCG
jgi:LacI family transcriptional regulator